MFYYFAGAANSTPKEKQQKKQKDEGLTCTTHYKLITFLNAFCMFCLTLPSDSRELLEKAISCLGFLYKTKDLFLSFGCL